MFLWVLLGFTEFFWFFSGFYWVLLSFTDFFWFFLGFFPGGVGNSIRFNLRVDQNGNPVKLGNQFSLLWKKTIQTKTQ